MLLLGLSYIFIQKQNNIPAPSGAFITTNHNKENKTMKTQDKTTQDWHEWHKQMRTEEEVGTRTFKAIEENEPCVIIYYHSEMIEVYRKDSKELLETLIHSHEYIDHIEEATLKQ
jgi:hypothetical protein